MRIFVFFVSLGLICLGLAWENETNQSILFYHYIFGGLLAVSIALIYPRATKENLTSELILGTITFIATYIITNNFFNVVTVIPNFFLSIIVAVIVGFFYKLNLSHLVNRLNFQNKQDWGTLVREVERYRQEIEKIVDDLKNKIIPSYGLLVKNEFFREYAKSIEEKLELDTQVPFINHLLRDQKRLLENGEGLYSREEYLVMLEEFSERSSRLYCINKTLPIHWYSPKPNESAFVLVYGDEISDDNIYRVTIIEKEEDLIKQYENAYYVIDRQFLDIRKLLSWNLILFARFFEQISYEFIPILCDNLSNTIKYQIDILLKDAFNYGDEDTHSSEITRISLREVESVIGSIERNGELETIIKNINNLVNENTFCEEINYLINKNFCENHKNIGSYYITKGKLGDRIPSFVDYGELGVYLSDQNQPTIAFATKGELSDIIKVVHVALDETHKSLISLFDFLETSAENNCGNICKIIEENER